MQIELEVAIGEKDQFKARRVESRNDGSAVTAVPDMVNGSYTWILFSDTLDDLPGPVPAAVVDRDNFPLLGYFRQYLLRLKNYSLHVFFLVVSGKEHRQRRNLF